MVTDEELEELNIKGKDPDKLEKIKAAVIEFEQNPEMKVDELAKKHGLPRRSLYYYLKKLNLTRPRGERMTAAQKEVRKVETSALASEAEKITTIAITIGGVIARRYLPFISYLMDEGKTLETIAEDVMTWFEQKHETKKQIEKLELQVSTLEDQVSEAYFIALPNFRYALRAQILANYARRILAARMAGIRVPIQPTLKALHNDLIALEQDIEGVVEVERIAKSQP